MIGLATLAYRSQRAPANSSRKRLCEHLIKDQALVEAIPRFQRSPRKRDSATGNRPFIA
ncbi:hypothetical protein ACH347_41900 [Saccharopolyspora sp. 5N102]|uniref:hypothetical protein n=1 Tax=Saccharopolyspora sp. 5N102 TaxID=3375155 RepID=UPI00378AF722